MPRLDALRSVPGAAATVVLLSAAAVLAGSSLASLPLAHAQLRSAPVTVAPPPVLIGNPDDPIAVDVDPAALAFLPAWGLTYVHADAPTGSTFADRGDGVWLGGPLPLGLATGLSVESVRPTDSTGLLDRGAIALALAWSANPRFGVGGSLRWVGSNNPSVNGLTMLDLSAAWRPFSGLGFALVGRNLTGMLDLSGISNAPPSTFVFATDIRPTGSRALTVEAAGAADSDGGLGLRGALNVAIPYVGSAQGAIEWGDLGADTTSLRATAGLSVDWDGLGAGGGVILGDGFSDGPGFYAVGRVSAVDRPGIPTPHYIADVEVRGGVDARAMVRLVARLDRAAHDDRVVGVLLRLRGTDLSLAQAQELRLAITVLERSGRKVVCDLEEASGGDYYACAGASRVWVDPAGSVRLMGPAIHTILIGQLLRSVGLHADFVRIGRYKSAPEQLTNEQSSAPAREETRVLIDDAYTRLVSDLGGDLHRTPAEVRTIIDQGPYLADEAVAAGLVSGEADAEVLDAPLADALGGSYARRTSPPHRAPRRWGRPGRIGVVVVDGESWTATTSTSRWSTSTCLAVGRSSPPSSSSLRIPRSGRSYCASTALAARCSRPIRSGVH